MPTTRSVTTTARRAIAACLCAFAAFGAQAQYSNYMRPGVNFTNMYAANADILLSNMMRQSQLNMMYRTTLGRGASTASKPAAAAPAPAASAPLAATDFRPQGPRDAPSRVAAVLSDPAQRAQMEAICRQIVATIEAEPGFRKHNVAAATAVLIGVSVGVVAKRELDDAQVATLMRGLNDEMVVNGQVTRWSAEQRTRAYDTMLITGGLIAGIAQNAAQTGDRAMAAQADRMARDALRSFGVQL